VSVPFELGPALLFCPADRPDRYEKALARADAVILDLEDAVVPSGRPAAREALTSHPLEKSRVVVRVNRAGSGDLLPDLAAVAHAGYGTVMLPKTASADDVEAVRRRLPGAAVIALCETAAGVDAAGEIAAHDSVSALMWGAEDLVASLGGTSSRHPDGSYRDVARYARSRVLVAGAAHGKAAIDTVHLDIDDLDGLAAEAGDAAAVGFAASACVHPSQVAVIRRAYLPEEQAVQRALEILAAAEHERGVFRFGSIMVDEPVLRHCRALTRRAAAGRR
jgi:citrate lyase subunit beta/citryl-CoA lyase